MSINADKPQLWKADTRASVDQFNAWFTQFAPKAYRDTRKQTIEDVERGLLRTDDLTSITPGVIRANPGILPMLRMSTCPPLARDRLIGLSNSSKNFVGRMEEGKLLSALMLTDTPLPRGSSPNLAVVGTLSEGINRIAAAPPPPRRLTAHSRQGGGRVGWQGVGTEFSGIVPRHFLNN